eukprot:3952354-Pyramimonas_sp.AAC.1
MMTLNQLRRISQNHNVGVLGNDCVHHLAKRFRMRNSFLLVLKRVRHKGGPVRRSALATGKLFFRMAPEPDVENEDEKEELIALWGLIPRWFSVPHMDFSPYSPMLAEYSEVDGTLGNASPDEIVLQAIVGRWLTIKRSAPVVTRMVVHARIVASFPTSIPATIPPLCDALYASIRSL